MNEELEPTVYVIEKTVIVNTNYGELELPKGMVIAICGMATLTEEGKYMKALELAGKDE